MLLVSSGLVNQEALKRILFIFAKLNPGIRYVQGMNEVLAPLYYVFKTDVDEVNVVRSISRACQNIISGACPLLEQCVPKFDISSGALNYCGWVLDACNWCWQHAIEES